MNLENLILFLLIGLIAGGLASRIMKGHGFGWVGDLVVGVIGAFLGGWLFSLLGISLGGVLGALVTALMGAIVLLYLLRLAKKA
ncbi:MAG: GlsB/YeaQ/YmgE family stress response membrane protein [Anaerolineae bacterium]|nr:GlsB/YeaQ/YmgE family stress response membrane protein [Anaerolineae bacterium]